jgi:hypothetical protein
LKNILSTKTNAIFLGIVLIAGIFAAISPSSFITGVNAQSESYDRYNSYEPDYGKDIYDKKPYEQNSYDKDRDYDKSKKDSNRSDLLKKLKCNNINANLNNVDANIGSPPVEEGDTNVANGEALAAQGGEVIAANGLMNGGRDDDRNFVDRENDFSFVCINNNNNTIVGAEPLSKLCEECFAANSNLQTAFLDSLVEFDGGFSFAFTEPPNTGFISIGPGTDTIEQFCDMIETSSEFYGVPIADVVFELFISEFLEFVGEIDPTTLESEINALIECLLEAGILVEGEPFPISISANGIAGANIECTGDPLCARLQ